MEKQVTVFLENGNVLLFQNVKNLDVTEEYIAFDYFGISSNQEKSAAFSSSNIAGWSATAELFKY